MTYLLSPRRGEHYTTEELVVMFRRLNRPTGRTIGGLFAEVESAGVDGQTLVLFPRGDGFRRADGGKNTGRLWINFRRSSTEARKRVRRLREDDAQTIANYDEHIAYLQEQIREQRMLRAEAVKAAWPRGRDVPLKELVDKIGVRP